ncbi:MAG: hypothetical protein OEZ01_16405 [Candidatus Heimdallarchaeota archaeon]|nr:hypothetical protein [Candidatus Heimdallarchaeota archaeon]MDH5647594.1 hypothetical protein [Candidatus Heimdallarchaeota archaeon]
MIPTQTINPHVLKEFIITNEYILKRKFLEPKKIRKDGIPRIGLKLVLVAICVFSRANNIIWRDLPPKLTYCEFLIEEGFVKSIPSKSTFHQTRLELKETNLSSWIRKIGFQDSNHNIED